MTDWEMSRPKLLMLVLLELSSRSYDVSLITFIPISTPQKQNILIENKPLGNVAEVGRYESTNPISSNLSVLLEFLLLIKDSSSYHQFLRDYSHNLLLRGRIWDHVPITNDAIRTVLEYLRFFWW